MAAALGGGPTPSAGCAASSRSSSTRHLPDCSARRRDRLRLHEYGWHMVEDPDNFDKRTWDVAASARRFECGSPNHVGIHGLAASLSLLTEIGIAEIERRIAERADCIVEAVSCRPALLAPLPRSAGAARGRIRRDRRTSAHAIVGQRATRGAGGETRASSAMESARCRHWTALQAAPCT